MNDSQNRRTFLTAAGLAVGALSQTSAVQAASQDGPQPKFPPTGAITFGVRQNVADMSEDHPVLESYRKAIMAMRKLNAKNPLSWTFQANMHGVPKNEPQDAAWKWCQHGNWWFLPWHRGYLYFFERIVRKMSGDAAFRLPYWAWDQPRQDAVPDPFRGLKYAGNDNPLFEATRSIANTANHLPYRGVGGSFYADWIAASGTSRFTGPTAGQSYGGIRVPKTTLPTKPEMADHGVMESRAHDMLHVSTGGIMSSPATAARDPIFWLHHANVDRLWNRWLDDQGHANPTDADWSEQRFPYYDENGDQVVLSVFEILNRTRLEYRYDEERRPLMVGALPPVAKGTPVVPNIVGVASVRPMLSLGTTPFTKQLPFAAETKPRLMTALSAAPVLNTEPSAVVLRVEGIQAPKESTLVFEVFVTKVGEKPSPRTYVGPITFFGRGQDDDGHGHMAAGFNQEFDVTAVIQKLRRANGNTVPDLEVSIVPHSTTGITDLELAKQKIDVPISNVTLQLVTEDKK